MRSTVRSLAGSSRLLLVMLILALGLVAAACAADDADAPADDDVDVEDADDAADAPVEGDPVVVAQLAEPASLDPHAVTAVNDFRINVNIYDGLVRYEDGSLDVEPALASDWDVSDDGTLYTFTLREDVTFHDGTPFNADAVVFNFERMLDENHPFADTGPFPLAEQFFGEIEEVRAVDEFTVEMELGAPSAVFLGNLAYPTGLLISPAAVEEFGEDVGRNPAGTGPYSFVEWLGNERVTLEANADYWDGAPAVPGLVFRPVPESQTRVTELLAGNADIIVEVPPDDIAALDEDPDVQIVQEAGPHTWFLILNLAEEPFDDPLVRQAVNHAIDREALVTDILSGTAAVTNTPIAAAFGEVHNADVEGYDYDPERARELLAEAGYEDGLDITFYVTEGGSGMLQPIPMAEFMQANLADVGINVDIETYEWNAYLDEVNAGIEGKAAMAQMAWMTSDPITLPDLTLRSDQWPDDGGFNSGYYANPEVDELIEAAKREADEATRIELLREMQEIVVADAPWVTVASATETAATQADIEGFELHPSTLLRLGGLSRSGG